MSEDSELKTDSENTIEVCPHDSGPSESVHELDYSAALAGIVKEPSRRINTVVNQVRRTVYSSRGDQALYAIMDTHLVDIEWVQLFSRHNNTSQMEKHQTRFLTRLTVANGTDASHELSMNVEFRGLGISFGASRTTFSRHETTEEREQTTTYDVPPRSSLYVYQRQYRFVQRVWWILDAWKEFWTVSGNSTSATLVADINVTISADERISSDRPLTGSLAVPVQAAARPQREDNQKRREFRNATSRAQASIERTLASANTPNRGRRELQARENGED